MKTAIKEVADIIEINYENGVDVSIKVIYRMLVKAMSKEKQQLKDAFNQGYREGYRDGERDVIMHKDISEFPDAKNYIENTFTGIEIPF